MSTKKLTSLRKKIDHLNAQLRGFRDFRPGSMTVQKRKAKTEYGEYWQLSYTHKGKGGTKYVPPEFVDQMKKEIEEYKRFKLTVEQLVSLSIEYSDLRLKLAKEGKYNYC